MPLDKVAYASLCRPTEHLIGTYRGIRGSAYADSRDKDVAKLMVMARTFGVERELSRYMGVLL